MNSEIKVCDEVRKASRFFHLCVVLILVEGFAQTSFDFLEMLDVTEETKRDEVCCLAYSIYMPINFRSGVLVMKMVIVTL